MIIQSIASVMMRSECQNWGNIKASPLDAPADHSYYLTKLADYIIQRVVARTRFPLVGANRLDPRCWTETGRLFHCKGQLRQPSRLGWEGFFLAIGPFSDPSVFSLQVSSLASHYDNRVSIWDLSPGLPGSFQPIGTLFFLNLFER